MGNTQSNKLDELNKSANAFILSKDYTNAGLTYMELGDKSDDFDKAEFYTKALQAFKNTDDTERIKDMITRLISIYEKNNNFNNLAKLYMELANLDDKIDNNEKAIQYFKMNDHNSSKIVQCQLNIADKKIEDGLYAEAADIYEKIADEYTEDRLLKYKSTEMYYISLLLYLTTDIVTAKQKWDQFLDRYVTLDENKFVPQILYDTENGDIESFKQHCFERDQIRKLETLETSLLHKIMKNMEDDELL